MQPLVFEILTDEMKLQRMSPTCEDFVRECIILTGDGRYQYFRIYELIGPSSVNLTNSGVRYHPTHDIACGPRSLITSE